MLEVAATAWTGSNGNSSIRVYTADAGRITERCWDTDQWYTGAYQGQGVQVAVTSWLQNDAIYIRVYSADANGNVKEQCWDGDGSGRWYVGAYAGQGNSVTATSWQTSDGLHIRVYTARSDGSVVEQCWDASSGGWYIGAFTEQQAHATR